MPPPFSAKKIHGVPAYKLARKHKDVPLKPVQVEIKEFEILTAEGGRASFRARVASGTYMRSVAHEMGQELGCGAHLESLRRTAVAEFELAEAHTLEELEAAAEQGQSEEMFVHPRKLLPQLPSVTANDEMAARIRSGRAVNLPELVAGEAGEGLLWAKGTDRHCDPSGGYVVSPENRTGGDCARPGWRWEVGDSARLGAYRR